MSFWRLVLRSLLHYARLNLTVALGVAAATAVLTGALIVGDSVRGSLAAITLDRLGRIDEALVADHFFRTKLAEEFEAEPDFQKHYDFALPVILLPNATVEVRGDDDQVQRAANVTLVGATADFWKLSDGPRPRQHPEGDQVVFNQQLAAQFNLQAGGEATLRLPKPSSIPADSAYGKKEDTIESLPELAVTEILPNKGLGRFSLRPNQSLPKVAYVSLELLQDTLRQADRANAILLAGKTESPTRPRADAPFPVAFRPTLEDHGYHLKRVTRTFGDGDAAKKVFDYFSFYSDQLIISEPVEDAARTAFAPFGGQAVMIYFVESLEKVGGDVVVPYSMVAGIDPGPEFPLAKPADGAAASLPPGKMIVTSWLARELQINEPTNATVKIGFFEPETTHGKVQRASAEFKVSAITPLTEPAEPFEDERPAVFKQLPTLANDPDFTPVVKGITDKDSIDGIEVPFPFDIKRLRPADHAYWKNHRTTPKAFISLADAKRLWGSRFGSATSFRIPAKEGVTAKTLEDAFLEQLSKAPEAGGMQFQPLKRRDLDASQGTTPFDVLFLLLSMFIIAAALMLVSLLFRLGVEQRYRELGTLQAVGFSQTRASRLFLAEGALVAAVGGVLGVIAGIGYAALMLTGLRTIWVQAVVTPFLELHIGPLSPVLGFLLGVACSLLTIFFGVRGARSLSVRQLLSGGGPPVELVRRSGRITTVVTGVLLVAAVGLAYLATGLGGEAQAGGFVGSGAMVLSALLFFTWSRLRVSGGGKGLTLLGLAFRNAGRNPSRSTTSIALMAVACFLIVSMSAFRLTPDDQGSAGFDLVAESSQAITANLNEPTAIPDASEEDLATLKGTRVLAFRVKPGDDASCRNLYRSHAPRVLSVTDDTVKYFDDPSRPRFQFAGHAGETPEVQQNPWRALQQPPGPDGATPVVLDKNTAMYSLQLYGGIGQVFEKEYEGYGKIKFRVAGLLSNSVLQGSLLVSDENFGRLFPTISGYRYFLIRSPQGQTDAVSRALEDGLGDQGFDTQKTRDILTELLAVQNTYLSTFQTLGALGLLLGTFGLATVQLRNVLERRGELAVMRAAGFRPTRLAQMVMLENLMLLAGGLAVGVFSAVVAVAPHMIVSGSAPPWPYLLGVLTLVFAVGLVASLTSVRATLRAPLLAALRGE